MITIRHVYPTIRPNGQKPPGLGDYLRGSIALAWHARRRGYGLHLELSEHPIGRFLDQALEGQATGGPYLDFSDGDATLVYDWLDQYHRVFRSPDEELSDIEVSLGTAVISALAASLDNRYPGFDLFPKLEKAGFDLDTLDVWS